MKWHIVDELPKVERRSKPRNQYDLSIFMAMIGFVAGLITMWIVL